MNEDSGSGSSLVNIGDLAKPAVVLIEKVSAAIGEVARPWRLERNARAEAKADLIRAHSDVEVADIRRRGLNRLQQEETARQQNIESVLRLAIPLLTYQAQPNEVENDWLVYLFDGSRLVSDERMQQLWAAVLAGEVNNPGSFSKRAIQIVSSMDKKDADLFTGLCSFIWSVDAQPTLVVFDFEGHKVFDPVFSFDKFQHLASIGLIEVFTGFGNGIGVTSVTGVFTVAYYGNQHLIEVKDGENKHLREGLLMLTEVGRQLSAICAAKPNFLYYEHIKAIWHSQGVKFR